MPPVRYVVPVGKRVWLRVYWDEYVWADGAQTYVKSAGSCWGRRKNSKTVHNAMAFLGDLLGEDVNASDRFGVPNDYSDDKWPSVCEDCGALAPLANMTIFADGYHTRQPGVAVNRQVFKRTLYGTVDGSWQGIPRPYDMYYADWYGCGERNGNCIHGWTNCSGQHLMVMCPDGDDPEGRSWDTGGRASNCGSPDDKTHRCWVVHGRPEVGEVVTVNKNGETCSAGGGSIQTPSYHGVLINGSLDP